VDLINLGQAQSFKVRTLVESLDGKILSDHTNQVQAAADDRTPVAKPDLATLAAGHTVFVKLEVSDATGAPVSDNFYWWAADDASYRELNSLAPATLTASATAAQTNGERAVRLRVKNTGAAAALMIKLTLEDAATGQRILPAYYSDNYVSLLPGEERVVNVQFGAGEQKPEIGLRGWNLSTQTVAVN